MAFGCLLPPKANLSGRPATAAWRRQATAAVAGTTTALTVDAAERLLPSLALWWTAGKTEIHADAADG